MDPEKNDFGKVIDALHQKSKLPSLRSYQGDVAQFIKDKNESVVSIAVKEKTRAREREAELETTTTPKPASQNNFQINFTILIISLVLLIGGATTYYYIFSYTQNTPIKKVVSDNKIISGNQDFNLTNIEASNLGSEIKKLPAKEGLNLIKISDTAGNPVTKAPNFFDLLNIENSGSLKRTLKNDFALGVFVKKEVRANFLIITINDFGLAFSEMLDWEKMMPDDLKFLSETNTSTQTDQNLVATSSLATSTIQIPLKPEIFEWKDLIVKNKDTRALVNNKKQARLAYAFLDKNTILIITNLEAVGEIANLYNSRSVVR